MILFYNAVYVYVCKIGEEKFRGWWRSFSWLGQCADRSWVLIGFMVSVT